MKRSAFRLLALLLVCSGIGFAQQPVNDAQVGGTPYLTGNGTTGAGSQRVTIASDNTAFSVNATLSAETTKAIGVVRNADGAGNLLTSNSTTYTAKFGLDANILGTLGTAFTTAGFVDIKGADGNVFVRQTTASNLKVAMSGNAGVALDFVGQNAPAPANALLTGGTFFTAPTTLTNGDASPLQLDSSGKLLVNCTGCSAGATVSLIPATSGGVTITHTVAAASTNATSLKGSAGQVYDACVNSNAAYPVYFKLYNKATAPTVGTDTPVRIIQAQAGVPSCIKTEEGYAFGTGIAWALTKGITDADATAVLISDATIEISYK